MLRVTVDVFSGRDNPSWLLDESEAAGIVKEVALNRAVLDGAERGFSGLGFRGVELEFQADNDADDHGLPHSFRIAHGASSHESKALEIADKLVGGMAGAAHVRALGGGMATPLDPAMQTFLQEQLAWAPRVALATGSESETLLTASATCFIETGRFNPAFWNSDPNVMRNNNCYNYASNRRTNTFAQPGRASGHQYTALTCPAVSAAARSDGCHDEGNCFPDSEKPRWYIALVIWPNRDYHWYRKSTEGFWGHKPGQTRAKNTDDSGRVIMDPRNANRGPYTQFCQFMYACKSQRIR